MAARYGVIQYVPDPIADERINIGVLVADEAGLVRFQFLRHWNRVRKFAREDGTRFLHNFVQNIEQRQGDLQNFGKPWTLEDLQGVIGQWRNSIQITELRASLKTADSLLAEIVPRFLPEPMGVEYGYRTKSDALALGAQVVRRALRERFGLKGSALVKLRYALHGASSSHHFDIVAANGKPLFAAETVSLEVADQRQVERDINAAGWALRDVKQKDAEFPTALLALMPKATVLESDLQENVNRVQAVSNELSVSLVTEPELEAWAAKMATAVTLQ